MLTQRFTRRQHGPALAAVRRSCGCALCQTWQLAADVQEVFRAYVSDMWGLARSDVRSRPWRHFFGDDSEPRRLRMSHSRLRVRAPNPMDLSTTPGALDSAALSTSAAGAPATAPKMCVCHQPWGCLTAFTRKRYGSRRSLRRPPPLRVRAQTATWPAGGVVTSCLSTFVSP